MWALLLRGGRDVQGLIAIEDQPQFVLVQLIESAPHNVGRGKRYVGVPGNLFACACARSLQLGFKGIIAFDAKSELIEHYERTLGARRVRASQRMIIETDEARTLVEQYFKEDDRWLT